MIRHSSKNYSNPTQKIKITPAVEWVTKSAAIVFVIKSLQFEISQEYQHDLSIKQYKYVYLSWVVMFWLSNNIPIPPFQRCSISFASACTYLSGEFEFPKSLNITKFLCKCSYVFRFVVRYNHLTCFQAEIDSN